MLIFTAKLIGLAYAISLIPLPLKLAHVAAIRSLLLWLLYSAVYIVRYSRRGNVPSGADKREGTIQKEVNYVKRFPVSIFYEPIIMPHHIRFMGSGKEPPCQN